MGLRVAVIIVILVLASSLLADAAVLYYEDFDGGTSGNSLTLYPMDWAVHTGDIALGSSKHGWSGKFVDGSTGTASIESILTKNIAKVTNGLIVMSCKAYAPGTSSNGSFVALYPTGGLSSIASWWYATCNGWTWKCS